MLSRSIDAEISRKYLQSPNAHQIPPDEQAYRYEIRDAKEWLYNQLFPEFAMTQKKLVIMLDESDRYALPEVPRRITSRSSPVSLDDILKNFRERILFDIAHKIRIPTVLIVTDWNRQRAFARPGIIQRIIEVPTFAMEDTHPGEVEQLVREVFGDLISDPLILKGLANNVYVATDGNPLLIKAVLSVVLKDWLQTGQISTEPLASGAGKGEIVGEAVRYIVMKTQLNALTNAEIPRRRLEDTEMATLRRVHRNEHLTMAQRQAAEALALRGILEKQQEDFAIRIPIVREWLPRLLWQVTA